MSESELAGSYHVAGFARRLGWGNVPALVVVDAVRAYSVAESPLYLQTAAAAIDAMVSLVTAARAGARRVVYTALSYRPDGADAPLFFAKVPALEAFAMGSALGRWPEVIAPRPEDLIVTKQYASAFFGTSLAATMTAGGIDTVVMCGFSTSGCVRASAVDAMQSGFRPMVVREAVADRARGPHEANLFDLDAKYADVVGVTEAVDRLRGAP